MTQRSLTVLLLLVFLLAPISPVLAAEEGVAAVPTDLPVTAESADVAAPDMPAVTVPLPEMAPPVASPVTVTTPLTPSVPLPSIPADAAATAPATPDGPAAIPSAPAAALEDAEMVTVTASDSADTDTTSDDADPIVRSHDTTRDSDAIKNFEGVVRQSTDYTCGPAALATLIEQTGGDATEDAMMRLSDTTTDGVPLLGLKTAAQKSGYAVALKRWTPAQLAAYLADTDDPVLVHDIKDGKGHFSVVRDMTDTEVYLSDTEAGNIVVSGKDFATSFTGAVLVLDPDTNNILIADTATNIADTEAATITGGLLYVIVRGAVVAALTAYQLADIAEDFDDCIDGKAGTMLQCGLKQTPAILLTTTPTSKIRAADKFIPTRIKKKILDAPAAALALFSGDSTIAKIADDIVKHGGKITRYAAQTAELKAKRASKQALLAIANRSLSEAKFLLGKAEDNYDATATALRKRSISTTSRKSLEKKLTQQKKELDAAEKEVDRRSTSARKLKDGIADIDEDIAKLRKSTDTSIARKASAERKLESEVGRVGVGSLKISIGEKELQHVKDRHLRGGKDFEPDVTSYFYDGVDIKKLIESAADHEGVESYSNRIIITYDSGKQIGYDRKIGKTTLMTVVIKTSGELVTAYPGKP